MWGGDGNRIYGDPHDDSEWAIGIGATELENLGHEGRAADISNILPSQGRPAELPGGGIPGPSGEKDGNADTLTTLACPGQRGHYGGGKHLPPTVPLMGHAGPPAGTKQKAPCHRIVRQGSGAKEAAASGGGAEGELREGLLGVWGAAGKCDGV